MTDSEILDRIDQLTRDWMSNDRNDRTAYFLIADIMVYIGERDGERISAETILEIAHGRLPPDD